MRKPVIGLIPLVDEEKESYWMLPGYMKGVEEAGGIPLMLPLTTDEETLLRMAEMLDGFLYTGGHDVSPSLYGQARTPECGVCCPERDEMEGILLRMILEKDKPLLGICRGIQLINALMGGTLYQDLPTEHPSWVEHHQSPPYDVPVHEVALTAGSPLAELLGKTRLRVNSYHHQAVREKAPELEVMAVSEDGLIEALRMPGKTFFWVLQWHPEFSFRTDADSRAIFQAFVDSCCVSD